MSKKLWLAPLAVLLAAPVAKADTLVMDNGRRIQGDLISINRNLVIFDQDNAGYGARRLRVDRNSVRRIAFDNDSNGNYVGVGDDDNYTPGPSGQAGVGRDVTVRADMPWTDTGVILRAGEQFRLDANGYVNWGPGRSDGPAGEMGSPYNANRPMPTRAGGALIGRVGNGEPFYVGPGQTSFRATSSGRLFLGVNDDYLRDNTGSFTVFVGR